MARARSIRAPRATCGMVVFGTSSREIAATACEQIHAGLKLCMCPTSPPLHASCLATPFVPAASPRLPTCPVSSRH